MREKLAAHRDAAALAVLVLALFGCCLFWIGHEVRVQSAARARQGVVIERRLCSTLDRLAALRPPAGDPAVNPARGYDQELHSTLAQLGPDVGCR